ncbi:glycosyltransferase family 8 protein [Laetiporus sulphureus 93-53]|uniref:Glycosyltransferase family 8 protein n=1 Tax=Laetiporus sulphureus 93-53 TaxID=1314785 RepID=A0A165DQ73_9APHY|nr:glycosyltransferase family 8 protein [Laetiporus sulphureus 93-53]KZT05384.1 glycosyltransferase family 8 protein [Laetiporus sulphureus 93-53]
MAVFSTFRRYKEYSPLWNGFQGTATSQRWPFGKILISLSVLANIFFLWKYFYGATPAALDNYQHLHGYPLLASDVSIPQASNENAIVTSLYTDAFAVAVATLGHTLNKVNSSASRIMIYLPEKTSPRAVCIASATGWTPHPVARIAPPYAGVHRHFVDQYSKLQLWTLGKLGVRSLVYLDADTLVRRNFDELFTLPYSFGAVPDVFIDGRGFGVEFNAGVLFLRPSMDVFNDMVSKIGTATYPAEDAEQSFLNYYYGKEAMRLPYAYNANLAIKKRSPALWEDLKTETRIVHYTLVKPFLQGDYAEVPLEKLEKNIQSKKGKHGGILAEEVEDWAEAWRETQELYGDAFAACQAM